VGKSVRVDKYWIAGATGDKTGIIREVEGGTLSCRSAERKDEEGVEEEGVEGVKEEEGVEEEGVKD